MAKFTVECPKCKTTNMVSTGLFAKKEVPCARCRTIITIALARNVIKKCPNCGKTTVVDEAKVKNNKYVCISCNKRISFLEALTIRDVEVACPHCRQEVMVPFDEENPEAICPICQKTINVAVEYNRQTVIKNQTLSVIEYQGDNNTIIYKHDVENFKYGTVLVVNASQVAIFLNNGAIMNVFEPGRYVLNPDLITSFGGSVDAGEAAFSSKVYFVNKVHQQGIRWAVPNVTVTDPEYNMQFKVSLSGQLGLQVKDPRSLLVNFMGTANSLENASFLDKDFSTAESGKTLGGFYRGVLVQNVNAALPGIITYNKLSLATINEHYRILGEKIRESLDTEFEKIGLSVPDFTLESIFFPQIPENDNYYSLVKMKNASIMDKKINEREMERDDLSSELSIHRTQNRTAQAEAEALAKRKLLGIDDDSEIIHETKETEKLRIAEEQRLIVEHNDLSIATENIRAFGEAQGDVTRTVGMAEADVVKAIGVAEGEALRAKGLAEADTMQAKGYTGKDVMKHRENMELNSQLPDLGAYFEQKDKEAFAKEIVRESIAIEKIRAEKAPATATNTDSSVWTCPGCGKVGITDNFCPDCGAKRPSVITSWNCACGKAGINSKFCPNCGKERP